MDLWGGGRYERLGVVLKGGQGLVELYRDSFLDRTVAIKSISDLTQNRRLADEIRALANLRSKHVVHVFDVLVASSKNGTRAGLVMEYVSGDDLDEIRNSKPESATSLLTFFQLASGIADVHAHGLVHRDIKPNNIKIDDEGVLKIFDFGLARDENQMQTIGVVGTPGFMAPELRGLGQVYFSTAVDVYAFASTVWWLFTGESPTTDTGQNVTSGFGDLALPESLQLLFQRCWRVDPNDRPKAAELVSVLERELLYNSHEAVIVTPTEIGRLNKQARAVTIRGGDLGSCRISYDGYTFRISEIHGDIYINNVTCGNGTELHESCLITIGAPSVGIGRAFATFDRSHPHVLV
jgi:eukaryotic-like serine/threonine-protein kinase